MEKNTLILPQDLKEAIEDVLATPLLENMTKPSFTFGRIEKLQEIYEKHRSPTEWVPELWINPEILTTLAFEIFSEEDERKETYGKGNRVETAIIKPADEYGKWEESIIRIMVNDQVAATIEYGGKHGDNVIATEIIDKKLVPQFFYNYITS